jgi:SAM-dependent methyltransferase
MEYHNSLVCPVCVGHEFSNSREVFDDRYGHPDLFELVSCTRCGHLMTSPMLKEEDLPHLYGTYYPRKKLSIDSIVNESKKVGLNFSKFRRWWMGVDNQGQYSACSGEKMLDLGCGSGLSLLEAQELGVEAWGIEADPNVKRISESLNLRIHQGSLNDEPFKDVAFDLIVLNQVIEHIPEPDKTLEKIKTRLAHNGRVIMVFPNVNSLWCRISASRWINWHIPYHLHHFNKNKFTKMAERCGYQIVHSRTITPNVWTILQLRAMTQTTVCGQPNPIWSVKDDVPTTKSKSNMKILFRRSLVMTVMFGISVVNRVVDSLGLGDSLVVELRPMDDK